MAAYSHHNLCVTVENRACYATLRCAVAHEKTSDCYWRLAAEENDPSYVLDYSHKWTDHAGGLRGGTCEKCGKTLKEVRVRINPKTGEPVRKSVSLARAIATTAADVPPIL